MTMKTDDLIRLLAAGVPATAPGEARRRFALALGWGAFGTTLLMAVWLGVRADIGAAVLLPMFWVKLAFPGALLAAALAAALRLSRPGAAPGRAAAVVAAPVLAMWMLAGAVWLDAAAGERSALVLGVSAGTCAITIMLLSVPLLVAVQWAMRGLAPTRPALAGAAGGLLAGAGGALVYALYCTEMAAPFIGIWYLAGMLMPAALGALLGRYLLRW
jgi:hypothetical protein